MKDPIKDLIMSLYPAEVKTIELTNDEICEMIQDQEFKYGEPAEENEGE